MVFVGSGLIRGKPGVDPRFQVGGGGGGAHLKNLCRAEGGEKLFWVFRVKNHDFMPKKAYFFQFWVVHPPPLDPPLETTVSQASP